MDRRNAGESTRVHSEILWHGSEFLGNHYSRNTEPVTMSPLDSKLLEKEKISTVGSVIHGEVEYEYLV